MRDPVVAAAVPKLNRGIDGGLTVDRVTVDHRIRKATSTEAVRVAVVKDIAEETCSCRTVDYDASDACVLECEALERQVLDTGKSDNAFPASI
jgi:hypothetical protein